MKGRTLLFAGTWKLFGGKGDGIHIYEQEPVTGGLTELSCTETHGNTSMLCVARDGTRVYAVDERKDYGGVYGMGGGVVAFSLNPETMALTLLNEQPSLGSCPAFVCVSPDGAFVAVANHGTNPCMATTVAVREDGSYAVRRVPDDGSIALFPTEANGALQACSSVFISRDQDPEKPAHCHSVAFSPDGGMLYACDKGLSRIYTFRVDREKRALVSAPGSPYECRRDARTRHIAFHPRLPLLFTSNEYEYSVSSYAYEANAGVVRELDAQSTDFDTLVSGRQDYPGTVDVRIHPNGKYLYVSNRTTNNGITSASAKSVGSDYPNGTISIFRLDEGSGRMTLFDRHPLRCGNPRSMELSPDGRFLYVADLDRDSITRYRVDPESGRLSEEMVAATLRSPSDLVFFQC